MSTNFSRTAPHRVWATAITLAVSLAVTGCGVTIPTDPDGTLDRVRSSGELRAGATPVGDAVIVDGDDPRGPLVDLVEDFAASEGATVRWTVAGEESLVDALEAGEVDLVVGGMSDATPWSDRASVSRGFPGIPGAGGRSLVFLVPLGENAMQSTFETYLDEHIEGER